MADVNGSLAGRVAVVTGGARGIGHAVVEALDAAGARCVVADVLEDGPERAARISESGRITYLHLDVTDAAAVRTAMTDVARQLGRLDILVTSAGVALHGPSIDLDESEWDRVIRVNLTGTFLCAREAARQMIAAGNGGSIVAIGSISGEVANTPQAQTAYNASKGGVHTIVRCLAVEWASHGIRVNAVAPGYVDTPLTRTGVSPEWRERWSRLTPMGRMARPEEIAAFVSFIAGDGASYVTGAVLPVDGGYLAW